MFEVYNVYSENGLLLESFSELKNAKLFAIDIFYDKKVECHIINSKFIWIFEDIMHQ